MKSNFSMTRRSFAKSTALAAVGAATSFGSLTSAEQTPRKMIGVQIGAVSFVDEGTEPVLDILQERGAVNTIFLTTFTYGRGLAGRQIRGQPFPDHGPQESDEKFYHGGNYATPHAEFYRNTVLKETRAPDHGDLDIAANVLPAARKRGLKLFCSIEDVFRSDVPGVKEVAEVALQGRRTGTLFVVDEVQTEMFRTGTFLAAQQFGLRPDTVVLAKALSGGLMPLSAVLITNKVYNAVYSSLRRAIVHTSTFSENSLSMRAGLATLDVLENEDLGARALYLGETFRARLRSSLAGFEMVKEVRGMGLLSGIEFVPPKKLAVRALYEAFRRVHPAMFGQIVVMRLFRDSGFLTQICGNNFMVLKVAPPLVASDAQLDAFVAAIRDVVELAHSPGSFWSEALGLARRAFRL